jgi:hypothetical protein
VAFDFFAEKQSTLAPENWQIDRLEGGRFAVRSRGSTQ